MTRSAYLFAALTMLAACGGSTTSVADDPEAASASSGAGGAAASSSTGQGGATTSTGAGGHGGGAIVCETPAGMGAFEVGTGEDCFEVIHDGDVVPLMSGPQGGYHLWLAVGCKGCETPARIAYGAYDPVTMDAFPNTYPSQAMVPLSGSDWLQAAGIVVYMPGLAWDPENEPPPAKGTHVILRADRLDAQGEVVEAAEVEVVIGDIETWDPCKDDPENPDCQLG